MIEQFLVISLHTACLNCCLCCWDEIEYHEAQLILLHIFLEDVFFFWQKPALTLSSSIQHRSKHNTDGLEATQTDLDTTNKEKIRFSTMT